MSIVKFKKTDIKKVTKLFCDTFSEPPWHDNWQTKVAYRRLLDIFNTPGFIGFIDKDKRGVRGFIIANIQHWYNSDTCLIQEMCVDSSMQRQGIGSKLIKKFLR